MPVTAVDPFTNERDTPMESALDVIPITPSDSDELAYYTKGISFGGVGALVVVTAAGNTRTIPSGALAAGVVHPLKVKKILSTGTTATDILAWVR